MEAYLAPSQLSDELKAEVAPFHAEYRRRPWLRYFLVRQANGHVHREMNCTTCYYDTEYGWLTDLSDCDEAAMVKQYGEKACTVCFPNAPVNPDYIRSVEAGKAKADSTCRGGNYSYYGRRYAKCQECGAGASVTPNGALRAHPRGG